MSEENHTNPERLCACMSRNEFREKRSMKVVFDQDGIPWLCDANCQIDETRDLEQQGCWRCVATGRSGRSHTSVDRKHK